MPPIPMPPPFIIPPAKAFKNAAGNVRMRSGIGLGGMGLGSCQRRNWKLRASGAMTVISCAVLAFCSALFGFAKETEPTRTSCTTVLLV